MCFIMALIVHDIFLFPDICMLVLVWGGVVCLPAHSYYYYYFFFLIIIIIISSSSTIITVVLIITIRIMASSASLLMEALSNLYIVVTYLCIKGWWLMVNKVVHAVHYLVACRHIGYGQLTHSILSAIFLFLAVPDLVSS